MDKEKYRSKSSTKIGRMKSLYIKKFYGLMKCSNKSLVVLSQQKKQEIYKRMNTVIKKKKIKFRNSKG